ncbi:MAG: tetratricopeptide repeat protein [PVC group bacterium]|nr:tetratricopeptide repeat protein [PVC group bacterium]
MRINLRQKIFSAFLGIIFFLILLETFLQIGAFVVKLSHSKNSFVGEKCADASKKILCLGDSYTYGIGTTKEHSYPAQLQRLLDQKAGKEKFQVINAGQPGMNTPLLADKIEEYLERFQPDIVLVMIGSNDNWNWDGFLLEINSSYAKINKFFSWSRTYKLARILCAKSPKLKKIPDNLRVRNIRYYEYRIMLGNNEREKQNYAVARKHYEKAIEQNPKFSAGYLELTRCEIDYLHNRFELNTIPDEFIPVYEKAAGALKEAEKLGEDTDKITTELMILSEQMMLRGNYYREQKKYSQAEQYYQQGIQHNPNLADTYLELARYKEDVLSDQQGYAQRIYLESMRLLKEAYALGAPAGNIYGELMGLAIELKKDSYYREALYVLEKARSLKLDDDKVYGELDDLFISWNNMPMAISFYSRLSDIYPEDASIYLRLGRAYKTIVDYKNACLSFSKALVIDPKSQEAKKGVRDATILFADSAQSEGSSKLEFWEVNDIIGEFKKEIQLKKKRNLNLKNKENKKTLKAKPLNIIPLDKIAQISTMRLKEIPDKCKARNIKVFFISYPLATPAHITDFIKDHSQLVIDLQPIFLKTITPDNMEDYFIADGHCTKAGYEIVAQEICNTLLEVAFLPQKAR